MKRYLAMTFVILMLSLGIAVAQTTSSSGSNSSSSTTTFGSGSTSGQNAGTSGQAANQNQQQGTDSVNRIGTVVTPDQLTQATTNADQLNNTQLNNGAANPFLSQFNNGFFSTNPFVVNPFTGQAINSQANPFNTGIILDPNFVSPGTGFNSAPVFPNGVSVNPNFPLNLTNGTTSGTTTLSNSANQNLTGGTTATTSGTTANAASSGVGGAGSLGTAQNSGTLFPLAGGVHFPTLILGSTGGSQFSQSNSGSALMSQSTVSGNTTRFTGTTVRGIVQRSDGTFTNINTGRSSGSR